MELIKPTYLDFQSTPDYSLAMPHQVSLLFLFFPIFLFSLSFHESAHAWVAYKRGDDTAKALGRLTLNPLPHMDLIGTLILPLFLILTSVNLPIGGWGKPVPIDPRRIRGGRKGTLWVALAGPLSNLILALLFSTILHIVNAVDVHVAFVNPVFDILQIGIYLNLGLAIFNLLPFHPLDGGQVVEGLLPFRYLATYDRIGRYGILIIIAGFYLGLFRLIQIPIRFVAHILIP